MLYSVVRVIKIYYPKTVLEKCKYEIKKNNMENLINDDLDPILSDKSDNESDNGSDNESDSESNFNFKIWSRDNFFGTPSIFISFF